MFTCLTKRIARHLPSYRHIYIYIQCKIQFCPTIKLNLLSDNSFSSFFFCYFYSSYCWVLWGHVTCRCTCMSVTCLRYGDYVIMDVEDALRECIMCGFEIIRYKYVILRVVYGRQTDRQTESFIKMFERSLRTVELRLVKHLFKFCL
jgi:hypothetical protein